MVNVTVQITNDNIFEGTQSFRLSLESTSSPQVLFGAYDQTTVYILDDEMITVFFSSYNLTVMESDGYIVVGVNASLPSGGTEVTFSVGTTVIPGTAQGMYICMNMYAHMYICTNIDTYVVLHSDFICIYSQDSKFQVHLNEQHTQRRHTNFSYAFIVAHFTVFYLSLHSYTGLQSNDNCKLYI